MLLASVSSAFLIFLLRVVHGLYVAFLVAAPGLIWRGIATKNRYLTHPWLCALHLACLIFVCLQSLFEWHCPLSLLESHLAGTTGNSRFLAVLWSLRTLPAVLWAIMATAIAVNLFTLHAVLGVTRGRG